MKVIKTLVVLAVLGGCAYGAWRFMHQKKAEAAAPRYRTAPIAKTDIVKTVEATGTVTPRNTSSGRGGDSGGGG